MDEAPQIESSKLYDFLDWAHRNRQKLILGVGAVAAVGIAIGVTMWRHNENETAANRELLDVPGAIVASASTPPASAESLLKVAADYPGTVAGDRAILLGADRLFSEGKFAEAQTAFARLSGSESSPSLQAAASYGVAVCLDALGKRTEAASKYQEVISQFSEDTVAPQAKLALGRIHTAEGHNDAAYRLYQDLSSGGPYDPWAAEANERRQELLAQFPDLAKSAPSAAPIGLPGSSPETVPAPKL